VSHDAHHLLYNHTCTNCVVSSSRQSPLGNTWEYLKWSHHIDQVTAKAEWKLGLIRRNISGAPVDCKKLAFHFHFQLGWAACAAQRLRPQHGSISHPQKIPSKYWVLKVHSRSSKKHNHPRSRILVADRITSLQSSDYSSPKKKGYHHY